MMAKPMKTLDLHYAVIQVLIIIIIIIIIIMYRLSKLPHPMQ